MKSTRLMNSLLFDAWKKAGLSEAEAKKAAMESARSDVALSMLNQSITRLEGHVNQSITRLEAHVDTSLTELRAHVDTSIAALQAQIEQTTRQNLIAIVVGIGVIVGAIGVAVTVLAFLLG